MFKLHRLEVGTGATARVEDLGDSILFGGLHAPGHGLSRSQKGLHLLRTHPLSSPPFLPTRKVLFPKGIRRAAEEPQQVGTGSSFAQFLPTYFRQPPILFGLLPNPLPLPLELKYIDCLCIYVFSILSHLVYIPY